MNILKKTILLSLVMILATISLSAQKVSVEEKVKKETDDLVAALNLDAETSKKIYDINLAVAQEKKVNWKAFNKRKKAGETVDKSELQAKTKELNKKKVADIKELLGKERAKDYKAYLKQKRMERKKAKEGQ